MIANVLISQIIIGDRRRDDLGDIAGLAKSIQKHGLLHPIVIDADHRLVAGERRLRAVEQLGKEWIEARQLGDLADIELREIELEENLRRKDLTTEERDRDLLKLVETSKEIIETRAPRAQVSKPARGPAQTPGSYRDVAERTGIPVKTIHEAEQHIEAKSKYPEIAHFPKKDDDPAPAVRLGEKPYYLKAQLVAWLQRRPYRDVAVA